MSEPRKASKAPFPYGYPGLVCYIEQYKTDGGDEITQCSTRAEIRGAVRRSLAGQSRILAVWPGQWSSDLFEIDDIEALAEKVL